MHLVNQTITNRYLKLRRYVRGTLFVAAITAVFYTVYHDAQNALRDAAYTLFLERGYIKANSAFFASEAAPYWLLVFTAGLCAGAVYGAFLLLFTTWRRQAESDDFHGQLTELTEKIFKLAESSSASMSTINWKISIERLILLGKPATSIEVVVIKRSFTTWVLPGRYKIFVDSDGMTVKSGYVSSLRLLAVLTLLNHLATLYIQRRTAAIRASRS